VPHSCGGAMGADARERLAVVGLCGRTDVDGRLVGGRGGALGPRLDLRRCPCSLERRSRRTWDVRGRVVDGVAAPRRRAARRSLIASTATFLPGRPPAPPTWRSRAPAAALLPRRVCQLSHTGAPPRCVVGGAVLHKRVFVRRRPLHEPSGRGRPVTGARGHRTPAPPVSSSLPDVRRMARIVALAVALGSGRRPIPTFQSPPPFGR
jgi:hypothetical protein